MSNDVETVPPSPTEREEFTMPLRQTTHAKPDHDTATHIAVIDRIRGYAILCCAGAAIRGSLVATACWLMGIGSVLAQSPAPLDMPNLALHLAGTVHVVARQPDGGMVVAGDFSFINNMPRNNIARISPDGSLDMAWNPEVNGSVTAVAVDAAGNVYVGGEFTEIGGQARDRLAKLSGTGAATLDPDWAPSANGGVIALAVDSIGNVYVGGAFTQIDGQPRNRLAKLSGNGIGSVDPDWTPSADSHVYSLALGGNGAIYVAGYFSEIDGLARYSIAKLSGSGNGTVDPAWAPAPVGLVKTIAVAEGAVYAGGEFTQIGGQSRRSIAKLSADGTGAADASWNPHAYRPGYQTSNVSALVLDANGFVYAGGMFTNIGGQARHFVARLSGSGTGAVDMHWDPSLAYQPMWRGRVNALAILPNGIVYAGGYFTTVGGQTRSSLARLDVNGAAMAPINAGKPGRVNAIAMQPDGGVIVGGEFETVDGQGRLNLLRLRRDRSLDPDWNPSPTHNDYSGTVRALSINAAGDVFVGGTFTRIGNQTRNHIAKLSGGGTGAVDAVWNPVSGDEIHALAVDVGGAVYASGRFNQIGGQSRRYLARLSGQGTGSADPTWNPAPNSRPYALAPDGNGALYVGGEFSQIGGQSRIGIAKLSGQGDGSADPEWNPSARYGAIGGANSNGSVFALVVDPAGNVYAGGHFTNIGGQNRPFIAKLSGQGSGMADPDWNPSPNRRVVALAVDGGGSVYAGGWFTQVSGQPRNYIARMPDSGTGQPAPSWNPFANGEMGIYYYDSVSALQADTEGVVLVGGGFTRMGSHPRIGLAALPGSEPARLHIEIERMPANEDAEYEYLTTISNTGEMPARDIRLNIDVGGLDEIVWSCDAPGDCLPGMGYGRIMTNFNLLSGEEATALFYGVPRPYAAFIDIEAFASNGRTHARKILHDPVDGAGILKDGFE